MSPASEQVVVVNGGANGIGMAICRAFAVTGATVAVLDIDVAAATRTVDQITAAGGNARMWSCDISSERQVEDAFAEIDTALGHVDVLVNNAGINPRALPLEVDIDVWQRVLAVNLTGYFLCARAAGRGMVARGHGAIVNISSIAGSAALGRGNLAYSVTKGGVDAMTRELAVEWGRHGVRVNAIAPCQVATVGFVTNEQARTQAGDPTASHYRRGIPLGRAAEPGDIAAAVLYLASDAAAMVTGVTLPVDGGNLAFNAGGTLG
jgi:NAD(P)-dependent dehydrogenase (short-subunit alcohol dehydrogenase family)